MTASPVVLGLDFGGTKIAAAIGDLSGAVLGSVTVASMVEAGAEAAMDRGLDAAHGLLASIEPPGELVGVGAATLGIPYDDRVELVPTFPDWGAIAFGARIRSAFPNVPVTVATDVKAAAAAELRWGALAGSDPSIYLNLGTGLAAAVVTGGRILTGANGAAGEIGYNLRATADVWKQLTERAMLEDFVSGQAMATMGGARLRRDVTAADIFALAPTRPDAAEVVDAFVRELAMHVVNLAIAIDPMRVAVGGGLVRSWEQIEPGLRRALDAAVPFPPELVVAEHGFDASLVGAVALGVEAAKTGLEEKALT